MEAGTPDGSVATALEGSSPPLMAVGLYADVHVPGPAIQSSCEQCCRPLRPVNRAIGLKQSAFCFLLSVSYH
jgi:hypothetical protein